MDNSSNNNKVSGNIFSQKYNFSPVNPFSGNFNPDQISQNVQPQKAEPVANPVKRLNGYDSAILNKTNFESAEDEELSIEYRIKEKEVLSRRDPGINPGYKSEPVPETGDSHRNFRRRLFLHGD